MDQRKHLVLFTKEALHNVVKHAVATSVVLKVAQVNGQLIWSISDDGKGYDPNAHDGMSTGTISMRERARQLNAELRVESAPGHGTAITLLMPL